jgi:hypothetical protein
MKLIEELPDTCVIISSNEPAQLGDERIIDGSVLSFRENAELTKYCTLLVGCSSGISWLCTSDWAKPLPMVQLLKKDTNMYASFVYDHEYQGIRIDTIIEMTDCSAHQLLKCIKTILTMGFDTARLKYHETIKLSFDNYAIAIKHGLILKAKYMDTFSSLRYTVIRYGLHTQTIVLLFKILQIMMRHIKSSLYTKST